MIKFDRGLLPSKFVLYLIATEKRLQLGIGTKGTRPQHDKRRVFWRLGAAEIVSPNFFVYATTDHQEKGANPHKDVIKDLLRCVKEENGLFGVIRGVVDESLHVKIKMALELLDTNDLVRLRGCWTTEMMDSLAEDVEVVLKLLKDREMV